MTTVHPRPQELSNDVAFAPYNYFIIVKIGYFCKKRYNGDANDDGNAFM